MYVVTGAVSDWCFCFYQAATYRKYADAAITALSTPPYKSDFDVQESVAPESTSTQQHLHASAQQHWATALGATALGATALGATALGNSMHAKALGNSVGQQQGNFAVQELLHPRTSRALARSSTCTQQHARKIIGQQHWATAGATALGKSSGQQHNIIGQQHARQSIGQQQGNSIGQQHWEQQHWEQHHWATACTQKRWATALGNSKEQQHWEQQQWAMPFPPSAR